MRKKKESLGQQIIRALTDFTIKIEAGIPIEATRVQRIDTPDGPLTIRTPTAIVPPRNAK